MEIMTYLKEETFFLVVIIWTCDLILPPDTIYSQNCCNDGKLLRFLDLCAFILLKAIPDSCLCMFYKCTWLLALRRSHLFYINCRTTIYSELMLPCSRAIWNYYGRLAIWLLGTQKVLENKTSQKVLMIWTRGSTFHPICGNVVDLSCEVNLI